MVPGGRLYHMNAALPTGITREVELKLPPLPKTASYQTRDNIPVVDQYVKDAPIGALAPFSGRVSDFFAMVVWRSVVAD